MKLGDFETYIVEGKEGGGLRCGGVEVFEAMARTKRQPRDSDKWAELRHVSRFLRELHDRPKPSEPV